MTAAPRPVFAWILPGRTLAVGGDRTTVMGVLNVTPDSFSDGGRWSDPTAAVEAGLRMAEEGAEILDIGGESSRPGAAPVTADEERRRVLPVLRGLRAAGCRAALSVDTCKAGVARAAADEGAEIVNDITALGDPAMADVVREARLGLVLMHMRGTPRTMQAAPVYADVAAEVGAFLAGRLARAAEAGIPEDRVVLDPGIGFGKTAAHNWTLVTALPDLPAPARPWLVGVSRKRFIGEATGRPPGDRLGGSVALAVWLALRGASVIRAHDVKETCEAVRIADMLRTMETSHGLA
jgi:dihydropteroate synthase